MSAAPVIANDISLAGRFQIDPDSGCWNWTGALSSGYASIRTGGKAQYVHRLMYEAHTGQLLEKSVQVDHICHKRSCINPAHLRAVTNKQNSEHRRGPNCNSKSGVRGVVRQGRSWVGYVHHNGKTIYVGSFATRQMAADAVRLKRIQLFTHNVDDLAVS